MNDHYSYMQDQSPVHSHDQCWSYRQCVYQSHETYCLLQFSWPIQQGLLFAWVTIIASSEAKNTSGWYVRLTETVCTLISHVRLQLDLIRIRIILWWHWWWSFSQADVWETWSLKDDGTASKDESQPPPDMSESHWKVHSCPVLGFKSIFCRSFYQLFHWD